MNIVNNENKNEQEPQNEVNIDKKDEIRYITRFFWIPIFYPKGFL